MEIETDPIPVPPWSSLSWDLTSLILTRLPLRSFVISSAVCRHWRSVTTHSTFPNPSPWLFLFSRTDGSKERIQAFGYDPDFHDWTRLPNSSHYFAAAAGFSFSSPSRYSSTLRFALLPGGPPIEAPEILSSPRRDPLLGVFFEGPNSDAESMRFIVAGGVHPARNESDKRLPTAIYAPALGTWNLFTSLPLGFQFPEARSKWLSSCVLPSRRLFVVLSRISGRISAFDLVRKKWDRVRSVSPPQSVSSYLVACGDTLVLACLCRSHGDNTCRLGLWEVDFATLDITQIGEMPQDLLAYVYDSRNHSVFKNVRCVGVDGRVYVLSESHSRGYPACVCEIGTGGTSGSSVGRWRKLPPLPWPVDCGEMIGFASTIDLQTILASAR